jgi:hypothetical protein
MRTPLLMLMTVGAMFRYQGTLISVRPPCDRFGPRLINKTSNFGHEAGRTSSEISAPGPAMRISDGGFELIISRPRLRSSLTRLQ